MDCHYLYRLIFCRPNWVNRETSAVSGQSRATSSAIQSSYKTHYSGPRDFQSCRGTWLSEVLTFISRVVGCSVFQGVLRDRKNSSSGLSKYSTTSLHNHHQNTRKPRALWPSRYSDEIDAVSQNVLAVIMVKPLKTLVGCGPTFVEMIEHNCWCSCSKLEITDAELGLRRTRCLLTRLLMR